MDKINQLIKEWEPFLQDVCRGESLTYTFVIGNKPTKEQQLIIEQCKSWEVTVINHEYVYGYSNDPIASINNGYKVIIKP